jgi:hypothetical protein
MTPSARKARNTKITARATFGIGVIVSLAANVYASEQTPIGIAVGLWVPTAFLLSLAMLENVPVKGKWGVLRMVAIGFIAAIAGWTSYWHLVTVAVDGGADVLTAHTLPLTVDVMMALAGSAMKAKAAAPARVRRPAVKAKSPAKLKSVA